MVEKQGALSKMAVSIEVTTQYKMVLGGESIALNPYLGQTISLHYGGEIYCHACQRKTKKSFSGGYCYRCSQKLAQCDLCIMKPETCHHAAGTCREPDWAEQFCMQDHIVYLANSSGPKVGITRGDQLPTRWLDQGASQALPIFRVSSRYLSGLVEVIFKRHIADKTDWRKMLKGAPEAIDLAALRDTLMQQCQSDLSALQAQQPAGAIIPLTDSEPLTIDYPVQQYPVKVKSLNFDKTADISGVLQGMKGQYLLLDSGVLNIRKFTGYHIRLAVN